MNLFRSLSVCAPLLLAGCAHPGGRVHGSPPRGLEVVASGEVRVQPDVAFLELAVETQARTAEQASQENAAKMQAVVAALTSAGVERAAISTRQFNVSPVYRYPERGGNPSVDGYRASNGVEVRVTALDRLGSWVDLSLSKGANRVDQVRFAFSEPEKVRGQAIEDAVAKGRAAAEAMARALGVRLGPVLSATTAPQEQGPMPIRLMEKSDASAATTPLLPETQRVQAQVTLVFGIE